MLINGRANTPVPEFQLRDDWEYLQHAFRAKDADRAERNEISSEHGIRWSALDDLPGWLPAKNSPLEFMHATFLGREQTTRIH